MAMNKLVAISYARVSTGKQSEESASGLERQELAIARWLEAHPQYELDREIKAVGWARKRDVLSGSSRSFRRADCHKAPALWWRRSAGSPESL